MLMQEKKIPLTDSVTFYGKETSYYTIFFGTKLKGRGKSWRKDENFSILIDTTNEELQTFLGKFRAFHSRVGNYHTLHPSQYLQ